MSGRECEVTAVIREVHGKRVTVETAAEPSCVSCGARILCGPKDNIKYSILIAAGFEGFKEGEQVRLTVPSKFILSAAFALYTVGVLAGLSVAALFSYIFSVSETSAAVVFLMIVAVWFITVTVFLGKFVKKQIKIFPIV